MPLYTLRHNILFSSSEEPPKPIMRTKTSVSNDYQFSPCSVQQLSNTFMYNYEYIGPRERLLLTPLTQRAFLSLTQALKNFHCGTLIGPAGRGKSETIKDLAKVRCWPIGYVSHCCYRNIYTWANP